MADDTNQLLDDIVDVLDCLFPARYALKKCQKEAGPEAGHHCDPEEAVLDELRETLKLKLNAFVDERIRFALKERDELKKEYP